jgi:hypothetical protein
LDKYECLGVSGNTKNGLHARVYAETYRENSDSSDEGSDDDGSETGTDTEEEEGTEHPHAKTSSPQVSRLIKTFIIVKLISVKIQTVPLLISLFIWFVVDSTVPISPKATQDTAKD